MLFPFAPAKNRTSGPKGHKDDNVYAGDKSPAYPEFFRSLFRGWEKVEQRAKPVPSAAKAGHNYSHLRTA